MKTIFYLLILAILITGCAKEEKPVITDGVKKEVTYEQGYFIENYLIHNYQGNFLISGHPLVYKGCRHEGVEYAYAYVLRLTYRGSILVRAKTMKMLLTQSHQKLKR